MTPKTCPACGGRIDAVNRDCEACRFREQIRLKKKEQEKFVEQLNSKEIEDTIQADNRKRAEADEEHLKEFDKRFRRDRLAEEIDGR